jgi:hypothetical protein
MILQTGNSTKPGRIGSSEIFGLIKPSVSLFFPHRTPTYWSGICVQIPDAHVPLLLRYLADVKGGVREVRRARHIVKYRSLTFNGQNLIKTCNGALASSDPPSQESAQTPEETAANDNGLKQTRARAILDVVSLPGNVDQPENS